MKKKLNLSMLLLLMMVVIISACGNNATKSNQSAGETNPSVSEEKSEDTVTYQSENGPVKVPAQPTRIVALSSAPNVLSLNGTVVGVDQWTAGSPLFSDKLKDVAIVSADDPEGVAAQNPDLIIVGAESKNIDQLQKIAPTVVYTWGKLNYLDQQVEIGKLLNKEAEAKQWVEDFSKKAAEVGNKIKAKYGDKMTVSVIEISGKDVYVMGDHWARGTEILFQAMKLNMPEKAKEETMKQGYNTLSLEVLPQYIGDFVVVSRDVATDNEIMKSTIWSKIPAVQNKHVIEIDTKASSYSDPTTLEYLLNIFEKGFLGNAE